MQIFSNKKQTLDWMPVHLWLLHGVLITMYTLAAVLILWMCFYVHKHNTSHQPAVKEGLGVIGGGGMQLRQEPQEEARGGT